MTLLGRALYVAAIPLLVGGPYVAATDDLGIGLLLLWTGLMTAAQGFAVASMHGVDS